MIGVVLDPFKGRFEAVSVPVKRMRQEMFSGPRLATMTASIHM